MNKRNKITLDNIEFKFKINYFPCLIMGICKSGASYFSVSLVADLIKSWNKLIFFTAFPMAKEELKNQIWTSDIYEVNSIKDIEQLAKDKTIVVQSWNIMLWKEIINKIWKIEDYIVFIKNIEEYDDSIFEVIKNLNYVILSWDIDKCIFRSELINKSWWSKIFFTKPKDYIYEKIPNLEKYESYFVSNDIKGILKI